MAMRRRAARAPLYDYGDILRLLDEENVECESRTLFLTSQILKLATRGKL